MDFIDQLRQKPAKTKKRIAFATSAVVTLAIFGIWASVLHFGFNQKTDEATAAVATSGNDVNPFSAFWNVLSNGWNGLVENINQFKKGTNETQNLVNALTFATSTNSAETLPQKDVINSNQITQ